MRTVKEEQGYTMLETIIYVGFLIVIGGWLASMAHSVQQRYKIGRVTQQILDLRKAVLHFTATAEDYSNLTIEAMNAGSSLPRDMRTSDNTTAQHALGGPIELGPAANLITGTQKDDYKYLFYITFKNLNKKACTEILTQGQFYGDGSDLDTLIVNENKAWRYQYSIYPTPTNSTTLKVKNNTNLSTIPSIHPSIKDALSACSDKHNNTITWIFS